MSTTAPSHFSAHFALARSPISATAQLLVSDVKYLGEVPWDHPQRERQTREIGEISDFRQTTRYVWKTVKIDTQFL